MKPIYLAAAASLAMTLNATAVRACPEGEILVNAATVAATVVGTCEGTPVAGALLGIAVNATGEYVHHGYHQHQITVGGGGGPAGGSGGSGGSGGGSDILDLIESKIRYVW